MFCPRCRADVAAELSTDNRRLLCARCSTELGLANGLARPGTVHRRSAEIQHEARELLARWKAESAGGTSAAPTATTPAANAESGDPSPPGDAAVNWRIDKSHAGQPLPAPLPPAELPPPSDAGSSAAVGAPHLARRRRRRRANVSSKGGSIQQALALPVATPSRSSPNWTILSGQLCAYGGVGLSTCGTALVLWAYFGGPEVYAPSGWLLTIFGQMLLFLGVIMLVSGGMEQTQREVVLRIEQLGDRLLRMEFAHGPHDLQGPHFGRQRSPESHSESDVTACDAPVASD
jgi:hypothetical protein